MKENSHILRALLWARTSLPKKQTPRQFSVHRHNLGNSGDIGLEYPLIGSGPRVLRRQVLDPESGVGCPWVSRHRERKESTGSICCGDLNYREKAPLK